LFVHDEEGPLGTYLRNAVHSIGDGALLLGLDDRTFAILVTSVFMHIAGILMLPEFLGPSFSLIITPFLWVGRLVVQPFQVANPFPADKDYTKKEYTQEKTSMQATESDQTKVTTSKNRRKRKKKKA
jgi:hypothetical protein